MGPLRGRAAAAVPADARRASAPTCMARQPGAAHGPLALRRRRGAGRHAGAAARRRARPHEPRRRARQRPVPRPRPVLRRPVLHGRRARASCRCERIVADRGAAARPGRRRRCRSTGAMVRRRGRGARRRPLHRAACPTTAATRRSSARTRRPPATPTAWAAFRAEYLDGDEASYQPAVRRSLESQASVAAAAPMTARPRTVRPSPTRAEVCVVACAEAFRGDGEILASPHRALIPTIGRPAGPRHLRARPAALRRRGACFVGHRAPCGGPTPVRRGLDARTAPSSTWSGRAGAT